MKRIALFLLSLVLFLTACATAEKAETGAEASPLADVSAYDPKAFVRDAGQLQFVEFFAYW